MADDGPVPHGKQAVGGGGDPCVVGHHEQGLAVLPEPGEQRQDLTGGPAVEVPGGLVGQDHERVVDQGACHRHPLALPA